MSVRPRAEVDRLVPAVHGGPSYAEMESLRLSPSQVLDFSVNSNPLGPSPAALAALASVDVARYPDTDATALRRTLKRQLGVPVEGIVVGNGSAELLWLLGLAYLRRGDRVLTVGPTFGEYEVVSRLMGAEVITYRAEGSDDFQPDVEAIVHLAQTKSPRLVFLCNPNNPTGVYLSQEAVERILGAVERGLLVLDEAYVGFVDGPWASSPLALEGNLVVLRSMTKDYALAGLRLGYGLGREDVISALRKVRPPWSVNAAAQAAGLASLTDEGYLDRSRAAAREARDFLQVGLRALGLRVLPTTANFFLVEVGDGATFRSQLLHRGIQVRDCASFGLPEYVRIAARPLPDCRRLIEAIADMRGSQCLLRQ